MLLIIIDGNRKLSCLLLLFLYNLSLVNTNKMPLKRQLSSQKKDNKEKGKLVYMLMLSLSCELMLTCFSDVPPRRRNSSTSSMRMSLKNVRKGNEEKNSSPNNTLILLLCFVIILPCCNVVKLHSSSF